MISKIALRGSRRLEGADSGYAVVLLRMRTEAFASHRGEWTPRTVFGTSCLRPVVSEPSGRSSLANVTVTIGGMSFPALYAGPQSQFPGAGSGERPAGIVAAWGRRCECYRNGRRCDLESGQDRHHVIAGLGAALFRAARVSKRYPKPATTPVRPEL